MLCTIRHTYSTHAPKYGRDVSLALTHPLAVHRRHLHVDEASARFLSDSLFVLSRTHTHTHITYAKATTSQAWSIISINSMLMLITQKKRVKNTRDTHSSTMSSRCGSYKHICKSYTKYK